MKQDFGNHSGNEIKCPGECRLFGTSDHSTVTMVDMFPVNGDTIPIPIWMCKQCGRVWAERMSSLESWAHLPHNTNVFTSVNPTTGKPIDVEVDELRAEVQENRNMSYLTNSQLNELRDRLATRDMPPDNVIDKIKGFKL